MRPSPFSAATRIAFTDQNLQPNTTYTYTVRAKDEFGAPPVKLIAPTLPAWLTFNAAVRRFTGTPSGADVGSLCSEASPCATITYSITNSAAGDDIVVEFAEGLTVHMTRRGIAHRFGAQLTDRLGALQATAGALSFVTLKSGLTARARSTPSGGWTSRPSRRWARITCSFPRSPAALLETSREPPGLLVPVGLATGGDHVEGLEVGAQDGRHRGADERRRRMTPRIAAALLALLLAAGSSSRSLFSFHCSCMRTTTTPTMLA